MKLGQHVNDQEPMPFEEWISGKSEATLQGAYEAGQASIQNSLNLAPAERVGKAESPIWVHKKTGNKYESLGPILVNKTTGVEDGVEYVRYRRIGTAEEYVRQLTEFVEKFDQVEPSSPSNTVESEPQGPQEKTWQQVYAGAFDFEFGDPVIVLPTQDDGIYVCKLDEERHLIAMPHCASLVEIRVSSDGTWSNMCKATPSEPKSVEPPLDVLAAEIAQWLRDTIPSATLGSTITKLQHEILELRDDPSDPGEIADCFFCLVGIADKAGVMLADAVRQKFAVNKTRTWGQPDPISGVLRHVGPNSYGLCEDCPRVGAIDDNRCTPCPRRRKAPIPKTEAGQELSYSFTRDMHGVHDRTIDEIVKARLRRWEDWVVKVTVEKVTP